MALIMFSAPAYGARSQRCFGRKPTIVGTQKKDILRGTRGTDVISGLGGKDRIMGRGGRDLLCGDAGFDTLLGGPGWDRLAGNGKPDRLRGGDGNDVLRAGRGWVHTFHPGRGNDRVRGAPSASDAVDYITSRRAVKVNLRRGRARGQGYDRVSGIEHVYGSRFGDRLTGDSHSNLLVGRRGADAIFGLANSTDRFGEPGALLALDYLVGGLGNDHLDGGANLDVGIFVDSKREVTVDLLMGIARGRGRDTVLSIEAVEGSRFGDTMIGDDRNNVFEGRAGNDSISGNGGIDIVAHLTARRRVRVNLGTGRSFGNGADRFNEIEDVYGSSKGDRLTGSDGPNRVWGMEGNDRILGLGGSDFLMGRAGRDRLNGGADIDVCVGEAETNCEGNQLGRQQRLQ
jgi:Ca2+-binding RTX toxin-like protein